MNRLEIINRTLRRLKQTTLTDLNNTSVRSVDLQSEYETTLDGIIARAEWSFAKKEICLTPITDSNGKALQSLFGKHIYPIPCDFIRKISANRDNTDFDVMWDGIYTNGPQELKMQYLFKIREEEKFPAYFINVLIPALCFNFSAKLNLQQKDETNFFNEQEHMLTEAIRADSYNKRTQTLPQSNYEAAHEGGY